MKTRRTINPNTVREYLRYEPDTGLLYWLKKPSRGVRAGVRAGGRGPSGYTLVSLLGCGYLAHRIIWAWMTGQEPATDVDHINGDRSDNRWCNLRLADRKQNRANSKKPVTNRSGVKGVSWHRSSGLWQARIAAGGREISLGYFATVDEARRVRQEAAERLHREFARHD